MRTLDRPQSWPALLHTVRAPSGCALLTAAVLLLPPQTQDVISGLWDQQGYWHGAAITFHLLLALLGLSCWHWARAALSARFGLADTGQSRAALLDARSPLDAQALIMLPRLLYFATLATAIGVTIRSTGSWPDGGWPATLPAYAAIVAIWLGGLAMLVWRLELQRMLTGREDHSAAARHPRWMRWMPGALEMLLRHAPFGPIFAGLLLALALLCFAAGTLGTLFEIDGTRVMLPLALGRALPGPGAVLLALAIAQAALTAVTFAVGSLAWSFTVLGLTIRASWLPVLLILAIVIVGVPKEVHLHQVRIVEAPGAMRPDDRKFLPDLFKAWATDCPGSGPLRPVIVALSGGASRAGLWGARVLRDVDEAARASGTGIFAISSVSGGSLGAAGYMSWRAAQPNLWPCGGTAQPAPEAALKTAMRGDALGPLLAGALFGDATRALAGAVLVPATWFGLEARLPRGGDRAAALERAFEANWRDGFAGLSGIKPRGLDLPYLALAYTQANIPIAGPAPPLWLANGTDQQNGGRLLTAPFKPSSNPIPAAGGGDAGWPFDGAKDVLALVGADMPVSAVIDNTSRFPFLSPVGELAPVVPSMVGGKRTYPEQIFDGGYFNNGGLQTAVELADFLSAHPPKGGPAVMPIIVQANADADGDAQTIDPTLPRCGTVFRDEPGVSTAGKANDQLTAPLLGLNGVRQGHGQLVLRQVLNRYCAGTPRFFHFYLYRIKEHASKEHAVPLNWSLSQSVAQFIWDRMDDTSNAAELDRLRQALAALASQPAQHPGAEPAQQCIDGQPCGR